MKKISQKRFWQSYGGQFIPNLDAMQLKAKLDSLFKGTKNNSEARATQKVPQKNRVEK
jgi:hypothetical protein